MNHGAARAHATSELRLGHLLLLHGPMQFGGELSLDSERGCLFGRSVILQLIRVALRATRRLLPSHIASASAASGGGIRSKQKRGDSSTPDVAVRVPYDTWHGHRTFDSVRGGASFSPVRSWSHLGSAHKSSRSHRRSRTLPRTTHTRGVGARRVDGG